MPRPPSSKGRTIFVNRYVYPDFSATSQMLSDVAFGLAERGREVLVIASRQTYEDASARLPPKETVSGVRIIRVPTTRFGRAGLAGRACDYLSFYLTSFFSVLRQAQRGDVVVIKTDPPLLSVPLGFAARLKGARVINWLQDIFPETAEALGVGLAGGLVGKTAAALRNRSVRRAAGNVVIGERMAERVRAFGAPAETITLIANFCDDEVIRPLAGTANMLRASWGFRPDDFVVGYSGNLGRAHDLSTLLGAAEALKNEPSVKFLFIGGGHLRGELEAEASKRRLTSLITKPYQPRALLGLSLCVPDVHWASLQPRLEGLILPSKLYGIAAAGRPLIMIGDPDGDIGRLVKTHRFGAVVPVGAPETLAARILAWKADPDNVARMGQNARAFLEVHASRTKAIDQWAELLGDVTVSPS